MTSTPGSASSQSLLLSPPPELSAVPNGVYARALWSQENRRKVIQEKRDKDQREALKRERARALYERVQLERRMTQGRDRAAVESCKEGKAITSQHDRFELMDAINTTATATQYAIEHKVRLAKQASFGRVAAARQAALEKKQQARREEGVRQQFALSEKARRLQQLRVEHAHKYSNKFALTVGNDWEESQLFRYSPLARAGHISAAPSLQSTASLLLTHGASPGVVSPAAAAEAKQISGTTSTAPALGWLNDLEN